MKRIALVFLLAILLPAIILAALAIRSVRDQEVVVNSQRALLHQATCDTLAADINLFMDDVRIFYGRAVDALVEKNGDELLHTFNNDITENWAQVGVGSVVSDLGVICDPVPAAGDTAAAFLANHSDFLTSRRVVEVYQAPGLLNDQIQLVEDPVRSKTLKKSADASAPESEMLEVAEVMVKGELPPKAEPSSKWKVGISQNKFQNFRFEKPNAPAEEEKAVHAERQAASAPQAVAFADAEESAPKLAAPASADSAPSRVASEVAARGIQADEPVARQSASRGAVSPGAESRPAGSRADGSRAMQSSDPVPAPVAIEPDFSLSQRMRNVAPSNTASPFAQQREADPFGDAQGAALGDNYSRLKSEAVRFNEIAGEDDEGAVSRLIDGQLHILLWKRHPALPGYTFWTELDMEIIREDLTALFTGGQVPGAEEAAFALLGSDGQPVARTATGFSGDWSRPFVAAEVGQILPRWEVAAYLVDPAGLSRSARVFQMTLGLIILVLLAAVAVGSFLVIRAVRYEMQLAARKTDFVSNVSHELKTPLTSIRMFSELLEGSEEHDAERTRNYSGVISKESARLSRLINRLLDFSRLDRGEWNMQSEIVDLGELAGETVECYRPRIEAEGLAVECSVAEPGAYRVRGDRDALSQVILNLISNAEKYAADGGEVLVEVKPGAEGFAALSVSDRGDGISKSHQRRIFEKFYRVDNSIDSGIDGSGIGLALCRQIAEKHGGSIRFAPRSGGGSVFTVEIPLATTDEK